MCGLEERLLLHHGGQHNCVSNWTTHRIAEGVRHGIHAHGMHHVLHKCEAGSLLKQ